MKRIVAALITLSAVVSCHKDAGDRGPVPPGLPCSVEVSITGEPLSKSVDNTPSNESRVNHLQVLVFDEEGMTVDYKDAGAVISTSLLTTTGRKDIWCLVNYPLVEGVASRDELLALTTRLSDNRLDGFVMTGHVEADLRDMDVLSVNVKRMVAKVVINRISSRFESGSMEASPLRITGIYMVNVASEVSFGLDVPVVDWANKLGRVDTSLDYLLYDPVDHMLTSRAPYIASHSFYVYPNQVQANSSSPSWTPRPTVLAVEVEMDGSKGWYPIVIPKIERNVEYIIDELVITRRPSSEPYVPVDTGSPTFGIEVAEWVLGLNLGKIII